MRGIDTLILWITRRIDNFVSKVFGGFLLGKLVGDYTIIILERALVTHPPHGVVSLGRDAHFIVGIVAVVMVILIADKTVRVGRRLADEVNEG